MELSDITKKRNMLQLDTMVLLKKFEEVSGCQVQGIKISRDDNDITAVKIAVNLPE